MQNWTKEIPNIKIGDYYSECCLLDLSRIENQDDLDDIRERIEHKDEWGSLMVFNTLDEAVYYLKGDGCGFSSDEDEAIARLRRKGTL